ncbi:MAG: hypothetical protein ACLUZX_10645 [Subdoligranulum sp.]
MQKSHPLSHLKERNDEERHGAGIKQPAAAVLPPEQQQIDAGIQQVKYQHAFLQAGQNVLAKSLLRCLVPGDSFAQNAVAKGVIGQKNNWP